MHRLGDFLLTQHDMKEATRRNYRFSVAKFEGLAGKSFDAVYLDGETVHRVLNLLRGEVADSSWNSYLICYKRFARWLSGDEEMPRLWHRIHRLGVDWDEKLKDKWLSEEEFLRLLDVVDYPRDKAMYAVCVSGGLRWGELKRLKVGDVRNTGFDFEITVSGKTGTRSFAMKRFAPLLKHWLNFHPFKHDPNAPLWPRKKGGEKQVRYAPLGYSQFRSVLERNARLAGLHKKVSPHWLRHTKVTWTALNQKVRISEALANKMFGWSKDSRMYSHYTHTHGVDTNELFLALDGVEERKVKIASKLEVLKCLNCNEENSAGALYCAKCGCVLDREEAARQVQRQRLMDWFVENVLSDPEARKKLFGKKDSL